MFDIAVNMFEQALIFFFLYSLTEEHRQHTVPIFMCSFFASFILISYINQFSLSQSLLIVIFDLILFLCLRLTAYLSIGKAIVYALLPYTIIAVMNTIIDMTVMIFFFPDNTIYEVLALYQIPFDICVQLSHVIAFYITAKFLRRCNPSITEKDWGITAGLIALCKIMSTCFETVYLEYETSMYYLLLGVYCIAFFIVLIFILFRSLYAHILLENRQFLELEILQSQIASNNKMLELRQELNSIRHDMKHFISLLKKENADLSSEQIQNVIEAYDGVNKSPAPIHSINPAVNYVLNIKQEEASLKKLNFICALNITRNPEIETSDLYLLLSNLVDNAIQHIGIGKTIRVTIKEVQNTFMIRVCNSVDGKILDENGDFIHSSQNEKHGHGIRTIQTITNKYHGHLICEQDGEEIICTVFIPY